MGLFRDRYRVPSARLQDCDYSRGAWYFVTICTRKHVCCFGDVVEGQVVLSPVGKIVAQELQRTANVRSNVSLDQWQIMPNHLHAILVVEGVTTPRWDALLRPTPSVETPRGGVSNPETFQRNVSTAKSGLRPSSLGSIIGQFKSACTKRIWAAGVRDFAWQTRFYDHIIRSRKSLMKIRDYIAHNPLMWENGKDNIENLPP